MKSLSTLLPLVFTLAACGGNPMTVAKERNRADERRRDEEKNNAQLEEKSAQLKTALKLATSTTSSVWTLATVTSQYKTAVSNCNDLGFSLPTTAEIAAFKSEVYDRSAAWQKVPFERFFKKDVEQDQTEAFGFVLCRHPVTQDIFQP
ncbi:MAG: hypothetical protein NTZ90_16785 [Proteobacteria bacterium]|nr:hypothetical protein [Pseudomonadota bacterium]